MGLLRNEDVRPDNQQIPIDLNGGLGILDRTVKPNYLNINFVHLGVLACFMETLRSGEKPVAPSVLQTDCTGQVVWSDYNLCVIGCPVMHLANDSGKRRWRRIAMPLVSADGLFFVLFRWPIPHLVVQRHC